MDNDLAKLYDIVRSGHSVELEPVAPARGNFISRAWDRWQTDRAYSQIGRRLIKGLDEQVEAAKHGSVVSAAFDAFNLYNTSGEANEPTGISFALLRQMVHHCEPLNAVIETLVRYATAYCDTPDKRSGVVKRPGFEIRMSDSDAAPSALDKQNMKDLTAFMLETGFCEPPDEEKPIGWQPGLSAFCAQVIRDTLTMDGVAVRRWRSADGRYPLISFAAEDAARIRHPSLPYLGLKNGVRQFGRWDYANESANRDRGPIKFLKVDSPGTGARVVETFTAQQLAYLVRVPRTETEANGYGYSETERCINAVTIWCNSLRYNASRFDTDSLPRGVLLLLGQLDETQVSSFKMRWRQIMEGGANKRWRTPILRGNANGGGAVQWVPIDNSQREMEYHNFMFLMAIVIHAQFGLHPEESGYQAVSPFKPPLSEASPEVKIENSSNKCFEPLLRWFRGLLNREIIWKMFPSKRYVLEFVGVGQGDEMADIQLRTAILATGLSTPRRQLAEMDEPVPEHLEDDPAIDMLGTFAANHALLMQMQSAQMGMQQQQQAMQQGQDAHDQQMAVQKMQATQPQIPGQPAGTPGQKQQPPGVQNVAPQPGERSDEDPAGSALMKALLSPWEDEPDLGEWPAPVRKTRLLERLRPWLDETLVVTGDTGDRRNPR